MNAFSKFASVPAFVGAAMALAGSLADGSAQAGTVVTGEITAQTTEVGYPYAAARIAACSMSVLYALNTDQSLYVNKASGVDSGWQYITTPQNAVEIACDGSTLIALNRDNTIWRMDFATATDTFTGWTQYAKASGSGENIINGGPGLVLELDASNRLYSSTGFNDQSTYPGSSWTYRGTPQNAARVAGALINANAANFYARNFDDSLWMSTFNFHDGANQPWNNFRIDSGIVPLEISAASPSYLYVLDTTKHLYLVLVEGP